MKCTIPEISWHNRDPVLSVDIQPVSNEDFYRLASGGTDTHVLIWHLKILESGATSLEPVCDLTRHQKAVNVVRWSPSGQYLASGDDDAHIIIWHQKPDDLAMMIDGDDCNKEKWNILKILRGHKEDVYDINWSPDSTKLISGSIDNTAIIWDLARGLNDNILTDHKGFVQGVTWDPLGQFVATLSSDRVCRIFSENGKQIKARIYKGVLPVTESHPLHGQVVRYFHDDTLKSYFRRFSFSPDGSLIVAPTGYFEVPPNKKLYSTYIFTTNCLNQPVAILPSPGQYTIAVKFCPILFQLRPDGPDPVVGLPYRMVFAVATRSSVILYDTQQMSPFGIISNIHYTRLTDITWSNDGRIITVSSTDGFCSLVTFERNELGCEYVKEPEPEILNESINLLNDSGDEITDTSLNMSVDEKKEKKPSFLEKWTTGNNAITATTAKPKSDNDEKVILEDEKENKNKQNLPVNINTPNSDVNNCTPTKQPASDSDKDKSVAKPIAVRRKPRDQMNITQFFKSPKTVPSNTNTSSNSNNNANTTTSTSNQSPKTISLNSKNTNASTSTSNQNQKTKTKNNNTIKISPPTPVLEDSMTNEPWSHQMKMETDSKPSNTTSDSKEPNTKVVDVITIDDSQDIQLVVDDTITSSNEIKMNVEAIKEDEESPKTNSELKMDVDNEDVKDVPESSENIVNSTMESSSGSSTVKVTETVPSAICSPVSKKKRVTLITLSSPKQKKK